MADEDDDIRDREVWTGVARHWYPKASDKTPATSRLDHHLAILARPSAPQQFFYYAKSLCVAISCVSAQASTLTLFLRLPSLDMSFVKAHGLLFTFTVPAFKDTWMVCLGDLGRYRMAIEDNDIRHHLSLQHDVVHHTTSVTDLEASGLIPPTITCPNTTVLQH